MGAWGGMAWYSHATTRGSCSTVAPGHPWTSSPGQHRSAERTCHPPVPPPSPSQETQHPKTNTHQPTLRASTPKRHLAPNYEAQQHPSSNCGIPPPQNQHLPPQKHHLSPNSGTQHPNTEPHPAHSGTMGSPSPAAMSPEPMCVRWTKFMGSPIMERSIRLLLFFCKVMKAVSPPLTPRPSPKWLHWRYSRAGASPRRSSPACARSRSCSRWWQPASPRAGTAAGTPAQGHSMGTPGGTWLGWCSVERSSWL